MKEAIKIFLILIGSLLALTVILFPIIISFYTGNFWLLFLYAIWWMPAMVIIAVVARSVTLICELWN